MVICRECDRLLLQRAAVCRCCGAQRPGLEVGGRVHPGKHLAGRLVAAGLLTGSTLLVLVTVDHAARWFLEVAG